VAIGALPVHVVHAVLRTDNLREGVRGAAAPQRALIRHRLVVGTLVHYNDDIVVAAPGQAVVKYYVCKLSWLPILLED
jgi:hypothetical protein